MAYQDRVRLVHITAIPLSLALAFSTGQIGFMKDKGLEVHALSSPGELLDKFAEREQVPVHTVSMTRRITPLQDIAAIAQIWWKLRHINPQIVNAHTPKGGLLGMIGAWLARVPVRIYHIHGLPFLTATGYKRLLLKISEKVSCRLAHQVLCVSSSIQDEALANHICPAAKMKVLLSGSISGVDAVNRFNREKIPEDVILGINEKYSIPADATVIGFVGRIVRDKGVIELVEAWKILREEFSNLHMLLVGPFELQDPVPEATFELLHLDPKIHLAGYVDIEDMPSMYSAMDILAFPSYREGFGLVAIEAASMKIPVVATRIPGCVDAVKDGITGILVPHGNTGELAGALRKYLNEPELRCKHGQSGRERVLRDFRPELVQEALYNEYIRLMNEKSAQHTTLIGKLKRLFQ